MTVTFVTALKCDQLIFADQFNFYTHMFQFLGNIFAQKCPRCRKGPLFTHKALDFKNFTKMPERCECCEQPFELEPSFYYGAMYVSYALQVALLVTVFTAYQILYPDVDVTIMIATVIGLAAFLYPVVIRLSRSIWIHFFVRFNKDVSDNCKCQ